MYCSCSCCVEHDWLMVQLLSFGSTDFEPELSLAWATLSHDCEYQCCLFLWDPDASKRQLRLEDSLWPGQDYLRTVWKSWDTTCSILFFPLLLLCSYRNCLIVWSFSAFSSSPSLSFLCTSPNKSLACLLLSWCLLLREPKLKYLLFSRRCCLSSYLKCF